jgi:hypothetical protein
MRKLLAILFLSFSLFGYSQKDTITCFKNYISVQPTDLVMMGLRFSYENQFKKHHSLKAEMGYKINLISYSVEGLDYFMETDDFSLYAHKAFNASVGYNFIFYQSRRGGYQAFLSGNFGYRLSYAKLLVSVDGSDGDYYHSYYSTYQNRFEFRALLGQRVLPRITIYKRVTFFEWYTGVGLSTNRISGTYYGSQSSTNPSPVASLSNLKNPIPPEHGKYWVNHTRFCFGLKIGVAWKKQKFLRK